MFFDIFLNNFGKKFNMFGIFCNNKLVKNPEMFVKKLRFFGKIFNIFGKRNKHDVKMLIFNHHTKNIEFFTKWTFLPNLLKSLPKILIFLPKVT